MLGAAREAVLSKDRARAAVDLLDLHLLSVHLPFDTVHGPVQTQILRALSGRFLDVLSLSGAIDDTLMELRSSPRGIPLDVVSLFEHVRSSLDALDKALDWAATEALLERLRGSLPVMSRVPDWTDLLMKNLASDIVDLALAHQDCRLLEHEFTTARSQWKRHFPARLHGSKSGYIFHRDRGLAVRSALGAAIGIIVSCALWIWTAWPDGATALSLVGVSGALFGTTDQPAGNFMRLLIGAVGGVAVGLLYGFVILPRTPDFVSLAAVIAPALLLIGSLLARPQYAFSALGVVLIFPIIAGLGPTNASDFSSAINGVVAIAIGSAMTVISLLLFQTIGMDHGTARILAAIRRDVAGRANGRTADMPRWTSRMMDRIGLLVPRLAGHNQSSQLLRHALADVRIGNAAGELWVLEKKIHYREAQSCLVSFLDALAAYYRKPKSAGVESLRGRLDLVMAAVIVDTSSVRECVLALLSDLRRDLSSRASSHEK
jgi:uncharacterized membrane protein YccC